MKAPAMPSLIDLRSDTVTQPTSAMRKAMLAAPLGDDVFGDDPSVNALQTQLANMLGFEEALFCASGTQSNLCAILAHCRRGDEYIVGQNAHAYRFEGGGAAVLGSVQPQPLAQNAQGQIALQAIAQAVKPDDIHFARTRLLCLENTWNGHAIPVVYLQAAVTLARSKGLATHLDGARLFNAAVVQAQANTGQEKPDYAEIVHAAHAIAILFDSVSVCFSKGLGAPAGSVLCGSKVVIEEARRIRKMLGGGMRQSGLLAAACSYALENHIQGLHQDHRNAAQLAQGLAGIAQIELCSAQTNIVFARTRNDEDAALLSHLQTQGILATGLVGLRFVTHMGIDETAIAAALASTEAFFSQTR